MAAEQDERRYGRTTDGRRGVAQVREKGLQEILDFIVVGEVAKGRHDLLQGQGKGLQQWLLRPTCHSGYVR